MLLVSPRKGEDQQLISVLLNNYFGRQYNSLNDVAINPRNKEIYFTDTTYGYTQDFRPYPALPNQVYRFNEKTGLVGVATDAQDKPNGAFSSTSWGIAIDNQA